ncbi:MAG: polysaccharide deacetylase family protein [Pseudomonadales bacterium]
MRKLVEALTRPLGSSSFLTLLENSERNSNRLRILTYHRVAELDADPDLEPGLISATPERFRIEMAFLKGRYNPISLSALLDAHANRAPLPVRAVLVTFDDGYLDFAENAWPVMRELGIPATLFVPTDFPDGRPEGFWWDRIHAALRRTTRRTLAIDPLGQLDLETPVQRRHAYRIIRNFVKSMPHAPAMTWVDGLIDRLAELPPLNRVLGWEALRRLAEGSVHIGSHSREHALLTRLEASQLAEDLSESLEKVRSELGANAPPPVLAYPSNAVNPAVQEAASRAGYLLSFGGERRLNRLPLRNSQALNRMPVQRYEQGLYRAQLRPTISFVGGALTAIRGKIRA